MRPAVRRLTRPGLILEVGDRVMVLKRGENVGDRYIQHSTEQESSN